MRLLFCIKAMDNPGGGAERVLADVASGLVARGHDVTVLSYDRSDGHSFYSLDSRVKRLRISIGPTTSPATASMTLRRMVALRKCIRARQFDVVIGFMHSMFIPLGLALIGTSTPLVASEHIVPEHYRSRPSQAMLLRLTPYLAERITCVSEQVMSAYPQSLRKKMVVVANPVTTPPQGRADVSGSKRSRKVLLSVGRLEPQKDQATLIEAFSQIAKEVPEWDLRIVGEGTLRPQLENLVAKLGLIDRVELPGAIKDISSQYCSAQLFVLPSLYESFGLTTAEALAHGLPVVGFKNCPGTNQLIRSGINGDLANGDGDRSSTLAETLRPLMQNDALRVRFSEQANGILEEYRIEKVCQRWESILADVSRNSKRFE